MSLVHERCQADYDEDYVPVQIGKCESDESIQDIVGPEGLGGAWFYIPCRQPAALYLYISDGHFGSPNAEWTRTVWLCEEHAAEDAWPHYGDTVRRVA
jgi:hypothetical protein